MSQSRNLIDHFKALPDPRVERTKLHKLADIMFIALCAVISGADSFEEMAEYGQSKEALLRRFLELSNGIPSHDTFNRVLSRLEVSAWQQCFMNWVNAVSEGATGRTICLDGKTARASRDSKSGKAALEVVSAFASECRLVLAQRQVEGGEIAAATEVLKLLELEGCIVTLDALHCQNDTAQQILAGGGDYVLAVKKNQRGLYQDTCWLFAHAQEHGTITSKKETFDAQHGRYETRSGSVVQEVSFLEAYGFPGLASVVRIEAQRELDGKVSLTTRYYLSSLKLDAEEALAVVRGHWGIENEVHWVLDVAFAEDASRARSGEAPVNLAVLRRLALNLLRQEPSKAGFKRKRFRAALDDAYLLKVLQLRPN
jgi:predicted transposase YbfD/YdcC